MTDIEDSIEKLRQEYCPPLDEAVFFAIKYDYDLESGSGLDEFRQTLDLLKESAAAEETADFDPSGTNNSHAHDVLAAGQYEWESTGEVSSSTGVTSIATGLSDLTWDDSNDLGSVLEDMTIPKKEEWLASVFPDLTPCTISFTLRKCNGKLNNSIDELLNRSFLDQGGFDSADGRSLSPKSIDGFSEEDNHPPSRKSRRRWKALTNESSRTTSVDSVLTDASNGRHNVWASFTDDVEFICARTYLAQQTVKSAYHANGASLAATIRALAYKEAADIKSLPDLDPLIQIQIADLRSELPSVREAGFYGLLKMTKYMPSAALELAKVMQTSPEPTKPGKLSNIATYAPPDLTLKLQSSTTPSSPAWTTVPFSNPATRSPSSSTPATHSALASTALSQARHTSRLSRSNPLYGGATAYYSSLARTHLLHSHILTSEAATQHVAAQSTPTVLDLHGVTVADAVRIAREGVNRWWQGLGDRKYVLGGGGGPVREGYRIVTGVGRHSRDGVGKLGPAVARMLVREGWRVEVGRGEAVVRGRART